MPQYRSLRLLAAASGIAGAMALAGCGSSSAPVASAPTPSLDVNADLRGQTIVVSNWENYMDPDIPKKFEAATGVKVIVAKHATNEEIVGKITAGGAENSGLDVAFVSSQYAQGLNEEGLLEPVDARLVPNMDKLYPQTRELPYDKGLKFSVPYAWGTTGLCYRRDLTGFDPTSWKDLLAPKPALQKKTLMLATQPWMNLPASKALGISANTTDPAQLESVKAQLLQTKPTLLAFDDTTFYTRLVSGEVALVEAWDGWCNYGSAENKQIKFVVPSEGSDLWTDTVVVLKSAKHKEAAMKFLDYIIGDSAQTWMTNNILYKSPNSAVATKAAADLGKTYPNIALTPDDLLKGEGLVYLGDAQREYARIATEVQAS